MWPSRKGACLGFRYSILASTLPRFSQLHQLQLIVNLIGTPHEGIWPGFDHLPLSTFYRLPHQEYSNIKVPLALLSAIRIPEEPDACSAAHMHTVTMPLLPSHHSPSIHFLDPFQLYWP